MEDNLSLLFDGLQLNTSFKFNKNYPVIYCENEKIYNYLFENEIVITNFKYPTYKTAMNRVVITSNHTKNDLNTLKQVLLAFNKLY